MVQEHFPLKLMLRDSIVFSAFVAFLLCLVGAPVAFSKENKEKDSDQAKIESIILSLKENYGLDISFEGLSLFKVDQVVFDEISPKELHRFLAFLEIFEEETEKYPGTFFRNSSLRKVIFCKKLFFKDQPAQGVFRVPEGYMFFDIYRDFGNDLAQRHGIHHEFFHMIDTSVRMAKGGGAVPFGKLSEWDSFNSPDFHYEREGSWHGEDNSLNYFAPKRPGFVTEYSYVSSEEDKAEIYACLFVKSQHKLLHQWQKNDSILAQKVIYIKKYLQEFCPQMNKEFWSNLFKK